jgi:hypothetical protein
MSATDQLLNTGAQEQFFKWGIGRERPGGYIYV